MGTKDALDNRKKIVETKENKDPELKKPTENIKEAGAADGGDEPITAEQIRNLAKNVYAIGKVVELHQHMHNEHYKTHKDHEAVIKEHSGHHELTHNVLSKMIDEKNQAGV